MQNLSKEIKKELDIKAYKYSQEFGKEWDILDNPVKDIYSLAKARDFLFLRFPNDSLISGMYLEKKDRDKAINRCIYINTSDPNGRQNFSVVHELYHAYYEKSADGICSADKLTKDPIEFTAERFASYVLIPRSVLINMLKKRRSRNISFKELLDMQKIFGVSFQALIYAISEFKNNKEYEKYIPSNLKIYFKFYQPKFWNQLQKQTQLTDKTNYLNCSNNEYEFPEEFKNNLVNNLNKDRIEREKVEEIFAFFGEKLSK